MFDVEAARKAGYSDAEIADYLGQSQKFDVRGARGAGYADSEIIAQLAKVPTSAVSQIPGVAADKPVPAAAVPTTPTLGERAVGTGEAALTVATGATGGTLGMLGGTLKGLAEQILSGQFGTDQAAQLVAQSASEGAAALTYQPRTEQGQEQTAAVAGALQSLPPVIGVAGTLPRTPAARAPASVVARAGTEGIARDLAGDAGAAVASKAIDTASRVADLATTKASTLPRRALEALRREPEPTPGTMGSAGAAGTDMAAQRLATAQDLPVPLRLTKGQASRDPAQLKFETETAKLPEEGGRLRARYVEQNDAILRNLDTWIDQTGAEAPNLRATGVAVDKALVAQAARDKAQVRTAYKAAEKAGEMEQPVALPGVIAHLNDSAPDAATAPLLNVARARAVQLGLAVDENGMLVPQPVPLRIAETFRRAVSRATDYEATNVRQATIIKGLVDEATTGMGGGLYKQARAARARYAQNYEDRATIARLLQSRKGTSDRQVAFEDVLDHAVLRGSLDDVRNVRRVLQRGGEPGHQAWKELQGGALNWIRGEATKNVATDSAGRSVISPAALDKAIRSLDHDGKLEFVFGKKGAQQLRDINELAKIAKTVPPEAAVNASNTASTLLAFLDAGFIGTTGTPVPVAHLFRAVTRHIRDVKLRRRINEALGEIEKRAPIKPRPPVAAPSPTVH